MSLALKRETVTDQSGRPRISKLSVLAAPYNAKVQNTLALDVQGTSTVKARIVSIPPPPRPEG
jgi:hypothetical protein